MVFRSTYFNRFLFIKNMNGQNSKESDESDDPIVREIPIINSKRLENILHLFQYPLRQKGCANEHNIKKCFFKPENKEVKLEVGINIESPNFDVGKAEIIAHEVDGDIDKTKKDKKYFFENEIVDKVFLQSSSAVSEPNKYAVAAYNGKEIHLTPLKGIFQFRPCFPYMEKGLKRRRDQEASDSDEEEAGPSSAQQVTVRFKQNDDRWKKATENSYKALLAKSAEEPWTECTWYEEDTPHSNVERLKLISDNTEDSDQCKTLGDVEYTKLLVPEDQEETPLEPTLPSHVLSLHALRALPIMEQCHQLLKDAQIIQFQQLLMLLAGGKGLTSDVLLKILPKVAVLVRGNWVVKSEVLYPTNTLSATSGVPAELMCRARDYVLYLFTKNQYVERKKVSSVLRIPTEEIKEIFMGVSRLKHNKGWELQLPTDQDFINKHTDITQKQNLFWENRFHQLNEFLKDNRGQRRKSRSESKSFSDDGKVRNGLSVGSDTDSGTEKNKSPVAARKNKTVNNKVGNQLNVPTDS